MSSMKKIASLILALGICLSILVTGCGGQNNDTGNLNNTSTSAAGDTSGTTEGTTAAAAEPAPVTEFPDAFPKVPAAIDPSVYAYDDMTQKYSFEIMLSGAIFQPIENDPIKQYMDKKFNTDVKFTSLKAEDLKSTVAVRYSSGDAPEVVQMPYLYKDVAISLFEQGNLIDATKVLPYMPQLAQYVTAAYKEYATVNGNMIGIPRYPTFADNWGLYIRSDWLDGFGMNKPATEDELFAYARACVEKDPNKNGKADTWFMGGAGGGNGFSMLDQLRSMYGHPSYNITDGKINHPMIDGTTRNFLLFLKKLNDNKLLAPDWYTIDWERFKSYSMNDQIGMVNYPGWNLIDETYNAHKMDAESIKVWEPMDPLKSNDGKGGMLTIGGTPNGTYVFRKDIEKDTGKLKRIAHFLDSCMYPNENYWAISQGGGPEVYPEGSRVTRNADGTNVFYINKDVHPAYTEQKNNCLWDWQFIGYTLVWQVYDDEPVGVLGSKYNQYVINLPRYKNYDMLITQDAAVDSKMKEFVLKNEIAFVLGKRSFDEWDKYVDEWKKAGGQTLLETAAKQLNASMP